MDKPTLLVVEDDAVNMMVIRLMLEKAGYAPMEARDGVEAVEVAQAKSPDIILMDIMMPRMDGIAAAREILCRCADRPPKMIAVTGNVIDKVRSDCLEAGFDSIVVKPIEMSALLADIERLTFRL
jgi:CheY-like chemotaxis protein